MRHPAWKQSGSILFLKERQRSNKIQKHEKEKKEASYKKQKEESDRGNKYTKTIYTELKSTMFLGRIRHPAPAPGKSIHKTCYVAAYIQRVPCLPYLALEPIG